MRPSSARAPLQGITRTRTFRAIARALVVFLLVQSIPTDGLRVGRPARAHAADVVLWVDAQGGCGGELPCHRTIQSAIDAVQAGQTVRVLPGEYVEQLIVKRKNVASRGEVDRIVIEADPRAPVGSVVLRGAKDRCEGGHAVDFDRSRDVTLRGLAISGAGARGVTLRGGARQNAGIRLERNRIFRGATRECSGGIEVGRGNPDTLIVNNLIHANGRHGIRFRDGRGGSYLVVGNTIVGNGWSGITITRSARAAIVNNLIAFNGTASGRNSGRHGVWRQRSAAPSPESVALVGNLVCGNRLGEIEGPLLDAGDADNQTPTGSEGQGVVASPDCGSAEALFAALAGPDGARDTADDDFTLAPGSPARDRGRDPRDVLAAPEAILLADFLAAAARPRDGDGDDVAAFDVGALEAPGAGATPTPAVTPTPTPDVPPTVTPTQTVAPPTATPTPSRTPLPTRSPTPTPSPTPAPSPAANRAPIAIDDAYAVRPGETLSVPAAGVLANDDDPDGNAVTAELIDPPAIGTLTSFQPDGSFAYQPPAQFVQPSLNPVARLRVVHGLSGFGQVADFDRDGHPDVVYPEFAALRALDGETGARLWDYDPSDTTNVNVSGCNVFGSSTVAIGDLTGGGDVSLVRSMNCDQTISAGSADRFVAINGSQIVAGKVRATWVTDRLTQPHPDALVNANAPAPPVPPIRPDFAASSYAEPSLARLDAGGGVKVLARRVIGPSMGTYLARNGAGVVETRHAGCRAVTGLAADQGRQCRVTWIVSGDDGSVEEVLTAPNPSGEQDNASWRPWRQNAPIVADLDGDGAVEIVSGSDVFRRVAGVWQLAWQTRFEPASVAVADLDGDGTAEVVQHQNNFGSRTPADVGIFVYRHDGTLLRRIPPKAVAENSFGFVSIGDADGDGAPDILYTVDGVLYVYRADGRLLWLFAIPDSLEPVGPFVPSSIGMFGRSGETAPQVYDLDLDGRPEVILNAAARLFIFDGTTGAEKWSIDNEGGGFGPKTLALADFDADGHVDILAMTSNRWNCSVGGGPVPCRGNTLFVSGQDANWAPGPKVFNQIHYRPDAVGEAGEILFAPAIRRDFRRAAQQGTVVDRRLREGATFTYRASDGGATSSPATVYVKINPENSPPTITSVPPTGLLSVTPYTRPVYQITATDPDPGDVLRYELVSTTHPFTGGVNVDPTTGAVDFYVGPCGSFGGPCVFSGDILVVVAAIDALGARDEQSFLVTISPFQAAVPDVVGMLLQPAIDALLAASLRARVLLEIFDAAPAGTVLQQNPAGGTANVAAGTSVELTLSKGPEPTPTPTPSPTPDPNATPTPVPTPGPPLASIVVEPANPIVLVGETQAFTATGVFADGTAADLTSQVTWQSSVTANATIGASGVASAIAAGATPISARIDGITGSTELTVVARVPSDFTDPVAEIAAPAANAEVTEPVDVVGTATDDAFLEYELAIAPVGESSFVTIAGGAAPVANGVLGVLDPTLLLNGPYTVRLRVHDRGGNVAEASRVYLVTGERKVGAFTLEFVDLEIGLSGIPIRVTRGYDSRDKAQGDFGVGWRLGVQTLRLATNRVLGTGFTTQNVGISEQLVALDEHYVTVTLPDGTVEVFDLQLSPTAAPFSLDFTSVVGFMPRPGTLGTLEGLDNPSLLIAPGGSEVELWDDSTFDTYDPRRFRYTALDGTSVVIDRIDGVLSTREPNGNTLTIDAFGITHSSGRSVVFARDGEGRITQITDPEGNSQTYSYDARGDLRSHTSAVGNVTRFTYDRAHGLLDIVDPSGARVARNEYDDDGRMIATTDAEGRRVEVTHQLGTRQEIIKDRLGNVSVLEYDAFGNVVRKTDAQGGVATFTFDAAGNQLSETDPAGRTATKTYDAKRNVLTSTDFDGNTTTSTYDAHGRVLTTTDPDGRTTTNVYDARGNPIEITDPEGGVTRHAYDAAGNRTSTTDPRGMTTTFGYDAFGNRTSETDPLGTVSTFAYDANGDPTSSTIAGQTTQIAYDAARRPTVVTNALGGTVTTTYRPIGDGKKPATVTDELGRTTTHEYDVHGRRTRSTYPDGSTSRRTYDAEGRVTSITDRDGGTSSVEYDALGRQKKTVHADGAAIVKTFDAAGRVLTHADERGNVTTYAYAPNRQVVTDPLGNVTTHDLDHQQRRVATTDALGRVTSFAYDSRGNLVRTTYDDGTEKTATYDLAGRKASETDQAGRTTTFVHDAAGRLTSVTDAAGQVTTYAWDAHDRLVEQIDANGHSTTIGYDALGRMTSRTRPLGQVESFVHDAKGNVTARTDFDGDVTTYTYDADDRQVTRTLPGGEVVTTAYSPEGRRTQAGGDTYVLDARGRILAETKASGDVLTYTYDAAGNRTSMTTPQGTTTYTYDGLNRLATVTDATGTTTYAYTAVGMLESTTYPNGVVTSYTYDALHRLVRLENAGPGGLSSAYAYTLGPAGNRVQVEEFGPATTGRMVLYAFDPVYRLVEELIDEPGNASDARIDYSYDAVGNRTAMDRDGVVTTYAYDANDRLTAHTTGGVTTTYTYDGDGNLASRSTGGTSDAYTYDVEGRLVAADVQSGANPGAVTYTYDADGMRTAVTSNGQTTTYLLDKNREHAQVVLETGAAGTVAYGYGLDLVSQTRGGVTRFHQYDGQLSTRQLTTATGDVSDRYTYDAFGVMLDASGTSPNVYLYAGEQLDPNVGFYYLRARYYDHATGRFTSTDPEEGRIYDPPSLHRYLYAGADPVDNADPSGRYDIANSVSVLTVINIVVVGVVFVLGLASGKTFGEALYAAGEVILTIIMYEMLFAVGGFVVASAAAPVTLTVGVAVTSKQAINLIAAIQSVGGGARALEVIAKLRTGVRLVGETAQLGKQLKIGLTIIKENKAAFCGAKEVVDLIGAGVFPAYFSGHLVTPGAAKEASKALDALGHLAGVSC